jgi:arylsulfatase A-like enzyme
VPRADDDAFEFISYAPRRIYAAMVAHMDGLVGRMVALLDRQRMLESTLIVFSADKSPRSRSNPRQAACCYP